MEFSFYLGAHGFGRVFLSGFCKKHLPADVLVLTPLRETRGPIANNGAFERTQNTCRQTFWTLFHEVGLSIFLLIMNARMY